MVIILKEESTGETFVSNSTITLQDSKSIDVLKVSVLPNLEVEINEEVKYYDKDDNFIFGGYVKNISNENMKLLEVQDYGVQLVDKLLNEVYRDKKPEEIIEDIITNHTDLTFHSSVTTTKTINKIVFKDERLIDVIKKLIDLFQGNWRTDESKNFYLEIKAETISNNVLTEGIEKNISGWKLNTDKQANKIIVKGANYKAKTTETISGTGTEFTLSREPRDLRVTVGGTELTQTVDGTIDGDYTVDVQAKKVTFETSQTDPTFEYTYDSQIKVTAGNGNIQKEIVKNYIETMQEARTLARNYLDTYQDGILTATFQTNTLNLDGFKPNYKIFVIDNFRTPKVSEYFTISKVVRKYPGTIEVTVGEVEVNIFDWQKETIERIKQLETKDDNSDFIQVYEFIEDGLKVKFTLTIPRAQYRIIGGNYFYLNHPTRGMLNSTYVVSSDNDNMGSWTDF